jgi:hypothetical protein
MIKNEAPIVFSCTDFFVPYLSAMIRSIMENSNPARRYHLFSMFAGGQPC